MIVMSQEIEASVSSKRLSVALGTTVGLAAAIGELSAIILLVISAVKIITSYPSWSFINWYNGSPVLIYLILVNIISIYHLDQISYMRDYIFVVQILIFLISSFLLSSLRYDVINLAKGACLGVFISSILLGFDYFFDLVGFHCHAQMFSGNPQWSATFIVILLPPLYIFWLRTEFLNAYAFHGLVAIAVVAVGAFTGARMAFYSLTFVIVFTFLWHFLKNQIRRGLSLLISFGFGVIVVFVVDSYTNCGFGVRIQSQVHYATEVFDVLSGASINEETISLVPFPPSSSLEGKNLIEPNIVLDATQKAIAARISSAGASRAVMWRSAIASISENWLLGTGRSSEPSIATKNLVGYDNLIHVHNQFLSWMIWGGMFGLIAGCVLIFLPLYIFEDKLIAIAFSVPVSMVLLSESLFALDFNFTIFMMFYIFVFRLSIR